MRKMRTALILIIVTAICSSVVYAQEEAVSKSEKAGEKYSLKFSLKKNDIQYLVLDVTSETKTQLGPMSMPITMKMKMALSSNIVDVDDNGVASVQFDVKDFKGTMNFANQSNELPSAMIPKNSETIQVTPSGEIIGGGVETSSGMMGMQAMNITQMGHSIFFTLPDKEIAVGESWKNGFDSKALGLDSNGQTSLESTLDEVTEIEGDKIAFITTKNSTILKNFDIDPSAGGKGAAMPMAMGPIKIEESSTEQVLHYQFNLDKGSVIAVKQSSNVSTKIAAFGSGNPIETTVKMEVDIKVVSEQPVISDKP